MLIKDKRLLSTILNRKGGGKMEIAYIYYIVKFGLDLYKAKKHSNPTKSAFSLRLVSTKFTLEITHKKY